MVAVGFDLRTYKIPNYLIVLGLIMGIAKAFNDQSWFGCLDSLVGIGIPIVGLIALYMIRVLGAGDIKLLAVIGSMIGHSVWNVIIYSFIAGGILSAIQMIYHHSLVSRFNYFWSYIRSCLQAGEVIPYNSGFEEGNTKNIMHFSIAILVGYTIWLLKRQVFK